MKRLIFVVVAVYFSMSFLGMEVNPAEWSVFTRAIFVLTIAALCILKVLAPRKVRRKG